MGRIRTIKPEFFQHEVLYDLEEQMIDDMAGKHGNDSHEPCCHHGSLRLAFAGLWCQADREGRFAWNPRRLKLNCLPYDHVDFDAVLAWLQRGGFIHRYEVDGKVFGWIPSFGNHQHINNREGESKLPNPRLAEPDLFNDQDMPPAPSDEYRRPAAAPVSDIAHIDGRNVLVANTVSGPFVESSDGEPVAFATNVTDTYWLLPSALHERWKKAYQGVNVFAEYARAAAWLESNPAKRKTSRGMSTFVNRWLAKQQDRGGPAGSSPSTNGSKVREL